MFMKQEQIEGHMWRMYLTLVSIAVALALENLISHMREMEVLLAWSSESALLWLKAGIMVMVPLTYWVGNCKLVLALRWNVGAFDALSCFFFLIMMNVIIVAISGDTSPAFFWVFGIANGMGFLALPHVIRRANAYEENSRFLAEFNYRNANRIALGTVIVALSTALLLQIEAVGVPAAVVASAMILSMIIGLLYSFANAWSQALELSNAKQ